MRLVASLLFLALGTSIGPSLAFADEPTPPPAPAPAAAKPAAKVPLRVVRLLPETHQALLLDRNRGTHVLVEVGTQVGPYLVEDIDADAVTLTANGTEVVLAAPERTWHRRDAEDAAPAPAAKPAAAPADPYAEPVTAAAAPADPYAEPAGPAPADPYAAPPAPSAPSAPIRVVEAPKPITAGEGGIRTVDAAAPAAPAPAPAAPPPVDTADLVTTPAAPPAPAAPLALTRGELGAALADFGKLATGIKAAFTPAGVRVDAVTAGSLFARAGLRAGDVITAVDGAPIRTLDDAADLYARAATTRNLTISLQRGGKPASLQVTIK